METAQCQDRLTEEVANLNQQNIAITTVVGVAFAITSPIPPPPLYKDI